MFEIKGMKTMLLWGLWYKARNIKAYHTITSDELHDEKSKAQLSRARKVIKRLEGIAVERGFVTSKHKLLTLEPHESNGVFLRSFEALVAGSDQAASKSNNKRPAELSFCSLYEKYVKTPKK